MATAACPCDGCDYEGEPSSVEAHVSACTDEPHKGKVGRDVRREIRGGVEEADDERADVDGVDDALQLAEEPTEEPTEEAAEEAVDGEETADEDKPDDEVGDEVVPAEAAAGAAAVGGGSLLMSEDFDVSGTTVAAGLAVGLALLLAWAYIQSGDESSTSEPEEIEDVGDDESDDLDTGLLSG